MKQEYLLYWHSYKYFPYEKQLGKQEVISLLNPESITEKSDHLRIIGEFNENDIRNLVYFSHAQNGSGIIRTNQNIIENGSKNHSKKQNTRYFAHGLHEYKGKFNPQIVKVLYNIFNISKHERILDPFCGSGTTQIEAALNGIDSIGFDINPLAVKITNAKIKSHLINLEKFRQDSEATMKLYSSIESDNFNIDKSDGPRITYLKKWFDEKYLRKFEAFRKAINKAEEDHRLILSIAASNLIRDYSLQEPADLRIRRRKSPYPKISFESALSKQIEIFLNKISLLKEYQIEFDSTNKAIELDIRLSDKINELDIGYFDFAITSPPYATALPYIDTQRLSLIWLDLIDPKEIRSLDSDLIGSREFTTKSESDSWRLKLEDDENKLPKMAQDLCLELQKSLNNNDGFRKQAYPSLLYRYFSDMHKGFRSIYNLLKPDSYFVLIVGYNQTTIGGINNIINTPVILGEIGKSVNFNLVDIIELQTYQRYDLHSSNSVNKEALLILNKP